MEKIFRAKGAELCAEAFGDPKNEALLLIMGAMSSMVWWDEVLCRRMAQNGWFVIRFDNRDTGRSSCYAPGVPSYAVDEMAGDCVQVLDFWGVERAHLLGMSLGGMLAQIVAIEYPKRALSLTCLASSVWASVEPPLPETSPELGARFEKFKTLDWDDRKAVVDFLAEGGRLLCGSGRIFNEARCRELAELDFDRSRNLPSIQNYLTLGGGEKWWGRVGEIKVPTVALHGTDDRVLPYAHGEALARMIPGAKLIALQGAGHELHEEDWERLLDALPGPAARRE